MKQNKTYTKGNVIVEDIKVGDIHYEYEYNIGVKCKVIETPCFPNSYKVVLPRPYKDDNSVSRFFPSKELAEAEARKIDKYINSLQPDTL